LKARRQGPANDEGFDNLTSVLTIKEAAMRVDLHCAIAATSLAITLVACASATSSMSKPGFYTEVREGRLWVFREGSKDLEDFKKHGEPERQVTRIGGGPKGMTIKSSDAKVIDEYLAK
jgi:hypothetical protein